MHRRLSNLSIQGMTGRVRSFVTHLMIAALLVPAVPVHAMDPTKPQTGFTAEGLMGLSGFRNLVLTIAMVNKAMRDASENPMDDWRRKNVQIAMGMMPGAIAGMAQHFAKGQLGDGDLPGIQAMLGGFIDKNAGDNYKKFLANPSKNLIPKTGPGFPNVQAPPVPQSGGAGVASTSSKSSKSVANGTVGKPDVDKMPSKEMVSLSQRLDAKTGSDKSVGYDDSVSKNGSGGYSGSSSAASASAGKVGKPDVDAAPTEIFGSRETASVGGSSSQPQEVQKNSAGLPYVGSETVLEASREMKSLSRAPASSGDAPTLSIIRTGKEKKDSNSEADEEFFSNVGKDGQAKNKAKLKNAPTRRPSTKPTSFRGNNHFLRYFALGLSAITTEAHAEAKEEGERSGGQAAAILMALAMAMGPISAMVIASTQANADKAIAKTNADAQIKMTEISAATQKEANHIAKDVALTQSATAKDVAITNNEAVTDRLNLQLAELRSARTEAQQAEKERRALDESYNQQRIALAEKQSNQNLDLAKETLASQLSEAGLRQSYSNSSNSSDRLTTKATIAAAGQSNATRLANGAANNALAGIGASASTGQGFTEGNSSSTGTPRTSLNLGSGEDNATASRSPASSASSETGSASASAGTLASRLSVGVRGGTRGALASEGDAAEKGIDRGFAADITYGKDAVETCKASKGDKAKYEACLKTNSRGRGASPQRRLLKPGTLSSNANSAPRGFASRLAATVNPAVGGSTQGSLQNETADMRAFAGGSPNLNKKSSFGGFIGGSRGATKATNDFVSYREQGLPHRDVASEKMPTISGGHKGSGSLRNLIDE